MLLINSEWHLFTFQLESHSAGLLRKCHSLVAAAASFMAVHRERDINGECRKVQCFEWRLIY